MLNTIPSKPSCAAAWLAAADHLTNTDDPANLIVDIEDPIRQSPLDEEIVKQVDGFLKTHKAHPCSSIANGIFPMDLYRRLGHARLSTAYLKVFDRFEATKRWGRYFERMIRWPSEGLTHINPLNDLIENLKSTSPEVRNAFHELSLHDPVRDGKMATMARGLSFLSFHLHPTKGLSLTAHCRHHDFMQRALGTFIGLGRLMEYIAVESGNKVGSLTCISTHADIENSKWTNTEVKQWLHSLRTAKL